MTTDTIKNRKKYEQGWTGGLPETPCGFGSRVNNTVEQRQWLADVAARFNICSVVDVGAGDLNWIQVVEWPHRIEYLPLDLVPRHPDVKEFDIVAGPPPRADLVLCFWLLNHLPDDEAIRALDNLRAAGARYLAITWREKWKDEPVEVAMDEMMEIESVTLNDKGDEIRFYHGR